MNEILLIIMLVNFIALLAYLAYDVGRDAHKGR
jgi:hypothetical protein